MAWNGVTGMYVSFDDGGTSGGRRAASTFRSVSTVTDMTIKDNNLVVATQGRAFWVLDDLGLVQQFDADSLQAASPCASPVNEAWRFGAAACRGRFRDRTIANTLGQNPLSGVKVIHYWLSNAPDSPKVSVTVFDKVLSTDPDLQYPIEGCRHQARMSCRCQYVRLGYALCTGG